MQLHTPAFVVGAFGLTAVAVLAPMYVDRSLFLPSGPSSIALAPAFVRVQAEKGHGSAVHIGNGYYLTAAHVADAMDAPRLVNEYGRSTLAETLWSNKVYDLALMRTKDRSFAAVAPLSCAPVERGMHVIAHGNPGDMQFVTAEGKVGADVREMGPWKVAVAIDGTIVPGMSGGGIVNDAGDVVAIVVGVQSYGMGLTGFGIAVPASVACELMGMAA